MEKEKIELEILKKVYRLGDFEWIYYRIKELEQMFNKQRTLTGGLHNDRENNKDA
tara:strand:- start:256 stop:420 length:165 start_codon:yes stop_codon:yes gene_type:complete